MQMKSVEGDQTAWMHVLESQVLKSEFVEGEVTSTTTQFSINVGEDAILHVSCVISHKHYPHTDVSKVPGANFTNRLLKLSQLSSSVRFKPQTDLSL